MHGKFIFPLSSYMTFLFQTSANNPWKNVFFFYDQNGHCTLIFFKENFTKTFRNQFKKGVKGEVLHLVACEYSRPSSLPRPVVIVTQTCHRGGSDTEDGGQDIHYAVSRTQDSYPGAFLYPRGDLWKGLSESAVHQGKK